MLSYRVCVACRKSFLKGEMMKVVRTAHNTAHVDIKQGMPGRGAYICKSYSCLRFAFKRQQFNKALKIAVPAKLLSDIEEMGGAWLHD